jgi:hypothetical protein
MIRTLISFILLIIISCSSSKLLYDKYNGLVLNVKDNISNPDFADSLEGKIIGKLYDISLRNNKFKLLEGQQQNYRYNLQITIDTLQIYPPDSQLIKIKLIDTIFEKYRKENERIYNEYQKDNGTIPASILASAMLNAVLLPMGYIGYVILTPDPIYSKMTAKEKELVNNTCLHAKLIYNLNLKDNYKQKTMKASRNVDLVLMREYSLEVQINRLMISSFKSFENQFSIFK